MENSNIGHTARPWERTEQLSAIEENSVAQRTDLSPEGSGYRKQRYGVDSDIIEKIIAKLSVVEIKHSAI